MLANHRIKKAAALALAVDSDRPSRSDRQAGRARPQRRHIHDAPKFSRPHHYPGERV